VYSYTNTHPLELHGLFWGELYHVFCIQSIRVQHKNEPIHTILSLTHDDQNNVQKTVAVAYANTVYTMLYVSMNCLC